MFLNRNEAEVTLGRADEFEELWDHWSEIQGQNDGYVGATLLQSYASPNRYTLFSRWVDRDASLAASRRDAFKTFARDLTSSGMIRPTRSTESYESIFEVDQPNIQANASSAERFVDLSLRMPQGAPALESAVRQLAEVAVKHAPGVLSVRLRRSVGDDRKYLMLVITTDRAAARGWLLIPEVLAHTEEQALNNLLAAPPSGEIHHVVKRFEGPALAAVQAGLAAASHSNH